MTIGENIRRIRTQRGLTQAELGRLIGISESAVRRYELNSSIPRINRLEAIAYALGVNAQVLLNADFDNITTMHRLFQTFRQYGGYFDDTGKLQFHKLNLSAWRKQWNIYQEELRAAETIPDKQLREYAIEDAEDKFNWWMDTYPKSDAFNIDFEKSLENYRKLKNKRRDKGNT